MRLPLPLPFALALPLACAPAPAPDAGLADLDAGLVEEAPSAPRHVILFVGDGMGEEALEAARLYKHGDKTGDDARLAFERLEVTGMLRTANASGGVTDSAAGATAMATGHKVDNGVISVALPGDGSPLPTALELRASAGWSTGLVTTATPVTDATPAAFGAHVENRDQRADIAADLLGVTRPKLLFGLAGGGMTPADAQGIGYQVVTTGSELAAVVPDEVEHLSGQFPASATPSLAEQVAFALDALEEDPDGFFLLVEHEGTDVGGHNNQLDVVVRSVLELEAAFEVARGWAEERDDTLIVLTADHETGGLSVDEPAPRAGELPSHTWSTTDHTGADVPVFAEGPGAELLAGSQENTRVFEALTLGVVAGDAP